MNRTEKFEEDLEFLLPKLTQDTQGKAKDSLRRLKDRLIELHKSNLVKINHSIMELVCAKTLVLKQYDVDIEHQLDAILICDLYATKGDGILIVEVETGFIPPEHALDPSEYLLARIASKIIRYSNYAGKFALGIPPYYILQIPQVLAVPPRQRTLENLKDVKSLCDKYYQNPPISLDEIKNARLHVIYVIDVDSATVQEVDPETYVKTKNVSVS
jgi:hypothetical protein